jgi:transcriptional regulator with XRE-family HTH domain
MPPAERARDRGSRIARLIISDLASELREARVAAGLSQRAVADAAGLTRSKISETERARRFVLRFDEASRHAAVLGLRLSVKAYPQGAPLRDAGQLRLLERFRVQVHRSLHWRTEVPIGSLGDLRAWDVQLDGPGSIGVDAEMRLRDIQAIQRRCETKWRDSGVDRVLVVAATIHNRTVLREHSVALLSTFPATAPRS